MSLHKDKPAPAAAPMSRPVFPPPQPMQMRAAATFLLLVSVTAAATVLLFAYKVWNERQMRLEMHEQTAFQHDAALAMVKIEGMLEERWKMEAHVQAKR